MPARPLSIGEVLRDARLGDLRALFEGREEYDFFGLTRRLFDLLDERQVDYVLVGGMAMLQYVDGRNTRDIDLILAPESLERLPEITISSREGEFVRGDFEGVQIDFLLTSNRLFRLARDEYSGVREFAERPICCATPEGLVLLKLFALPSLYRQGDGVRAAIYEADIRALLTAADIDTDSILATLSAEMLDTDVAELRRLVDDIRAGMKRFQ
ncbi:MAG: hypothetical protein C0506_00040 [Anaerolinea sp.]|nr:hypothetical protein [Anaerolinea sp.]